MTSDEADLTFVYHRDQLPVETWRQIMAVCQNYECRLLGGETISPSDHAALHANLPSEILVAELERLRDEIQSPHEPHPISDCLPAERYLILETIRTGGMGEVFRAFDRKCGRLVALKKIRHEYADDPDMRRRFIAEVELTAELEHPGVIPIYDQAVDETGREFYVMRLIHGEGTGTLQQAIGRFHAGADPKPWNSARKAVFRDLIESVVISAKTIAYAHSRGIVHRDLKPSNCLIGPYGETLIADWGLARRIHPSPPPVESESMDDTASSSGVARSGPPPSLRNAVGETSIGTGAHGVGTPGFAAPEVGSVTPRTNWIAADIYSIGAMLSCVLTGESSKRTLGAGPPAPNDRRAAAPELLAIAARAMSTDIAKRYRTAQSLCDDLNNWLAGEPVAAYPESVLERLWKWPTRHRTAATTAASVFLLTLIALGAFSWLQTRQKAELAARSLELADALRRSNLLFEENRRTGLAFQQASSEREKLALRAITEFQSLLRLNPSISSSLAYNDVRQKVLDESRNFYGSLLESLDRTGEIHSESLHRLSEAATSLALLENEFGNHAEAIRVADSACSRLKSATESPQSPNASDEVLRYHIGRLLSIQGGIALKNGWPAQGREDQQESLPWLEPLIGSKILSESQAADACALWCKAASPMAIAMAGKGEHQAATALLQRILSLLESGPPGDFENHLLEMQSLGNLALVRHSAGDNEAAFAALDRAEATADRCEGLIDQHLLIRSVLEYQSFRSLLSQVRGDMLLSIGKTEEATGHLTAALERMQQLVKEHPSSQELQGAYQNIQNRLQTVLAQAGRFAEAKGLSIAWLRLAEGLVSEYEQNTELVEFLMLAQHADGHLSDRAGQVSEAERSYQAALDSARSLALAKQIDEGLQHQIVELNVHLVKIRLQPDQSQVAESHLQEAFDYACKIVANSQGNEAIRSNLTLQMQASLRYLEQAGMSEREAYWSNQIREAGLLPAADSVRKPD